MNCLLTGSNGFIGRRLVEELSAGGNKVKCLVRSPEKFRELSSLPGVTPIVGDLDAVDVLEEASACCDTVFHLAAYAKPWSKDRSLPYRINVAGTENVLRAARKAGVRRFVFTSSAAVIGPSPGTEPIDESFLRTVPWFNEYEETKAAAEELVRSYNRDGMECVIVNPTRVYGPGPINESNSVTKMISLYARGRWRIIPGDGKCVGNYVMVDDVVRGHILAAQKGRPGEQYILGGENLTFDTFFDTLATLTGRRLWLVKMPVSLMSAAAGVMEWQASFTGIPPLITPSWIKKYLNHWSLSSRKATEDMGYQPRPFAEGAKITMEWLQSGFER
ncbi:MAG: SDR family oxidoreductase [Bacteroidales bacterium]|nr:SDR family oxidoreductase [Bacteroidales bacterium]MDX9925899.1 SDR family oxidoreductase [Bacteroidales bacterium]HNX82901.1 SDR family oxidoreductase [Bacteroidales bacterium]HOC47457.1 SDR family oxidoreductase [Bacteroidales bacterium]HPS97083.1 SDR family oxidoreductase [Bacteroidales bacterium]